MEEGSKVVRRAGVRCRGGGRGPIAPRQPGTSVHSLFTSAPCVTRPRHHQAHHHHHSAGRGAPRAAGAQGRARGQIRPDARQDQAGHSNSVCRVKDLSVGRRRAGPERRLKAEHSEEGAHPGPGERVGLCGTREAAGWAAESVEVRSSGHGGRVTPAWGGHKRVRAAGACPVPWA